MLEHRKKFYVTENIYQSLTSALYKLADTFNIDTPALHLAVSVVFSSIFKKNNIPCVIVGGQSAAYWMRVPGSTDIDFVSPAINKIATILEQCGFNKSIDLSFRYTHLPTNVMIELVGDKINIADIISGPTMLVKPSDIEHNDVRSLMPGPAEVIDPVCVFLNYINATSPESIWHDFANQGALAVERANALLALYYDYIKAGLQQKFKTGELPETLVKLLSEKYSLSVK